MNFPASKAEAAEPGRVLDPSRAGPEAEALEANLRKLIVGQDEAIQEIVNIYQMYLTGIAAPGRPVGNFLFLGPTGSGKTRIVEATAQSLVGNAQAVVKVDCAEFQHSHEIAKLVGSPPGYLGHRETQPLLSQEHLDQYHTDRVKLSFVLLDEIEKASDAVWNLLLGILDKATLRLGDNRKVDFSRAMIFMTSNLGAAEMSAVLRPRLGFTPAVAATPQAGGLVDGKLSEKISKTGYEAARRKFTPEFINRIDKIVVFNLLGEAELRQILDIELRMVQQRVLTDCGAPFGFTVTQAAKDHLLREGTDSRYGARHLKRAIERLLIHPISNLVASEQVRNGDWVRVDFDSGQNNMRFLQEAQGMSLHRVAERIEASTPAPLRAPTAALSSEASPSRTPSAPLGEVNFEVNFGE
jgi:ATP-dependent Clp protease ATP-binding subunit ClpA